MEGIILVAIIVAACFGAGYWLLVRPVRQLQETTSEMRTLLTATQTALAQSQQETIALRRALTSTNVQGHWGEMQLRRIVELAGMVPYCDFEPQVTLPGVNGTQRPDLLVRLSNGRTIVVDVKAPINSYIQAHANADNAARMTAELRQYARLVRGHMTTLAKREYWKHFEPTPAWVVLLIPNEGMFRAVLEHDPSILDDGTQQHVLLASPITLLALLKAMAYGWQQENRARNVQQIIQHSHTLLQKMGEFRKQWLNLHKELRETTTVFNQLTVTYQTTILPVIQQIRDLDGTISTSLYDFSSMQPLVGPQNIEEAAFLMMEERAETHMVSSPQAASDNSTIQSTENQT